MGGVEGSKKRKVEVCEESYSGYLQSIQRADGAG